MKMYRTLLGLFGLLVTVKAANYQRYGETTNYPAYSTGSSLYNNYPYKSGSYGSDIASFPDATRYPNSPGQTSSYGNGYTSGYGSNYGPGYGYGSSYTTSGYGSGSYNGYNGAGGSFNNYNSAGGSYNNYNRGLNGLNSLNNYNSGYSTPRYGDSYGQGYTGYEMPFMGSPGGSGYCVNRSPQNGIWVDRLMGMWYGVELIHHINGDSRVRFEYTCIVIHISEPMDPPSTEHQVIHVQQLTAKFRQENRHVRLLWDEAGQTVEYSLYFRNDSAGYWHIYERQNGSLTTLPKYQQFTGAVQVLKAVNDHLVLNFCEESNNGRPAQLFSVLFSREPGIIAQWEVDSVHSMLQTKRLSTASRRMVCGNSGAEKVSFSAILGVTAISYLVACLVRSF